MCPSYKKSDGTGNGDMKVNRIRFTNTFLSVLIASSVFMCGCGSSADETTVTLKKSGEIDCDFVEDFDKDYYSVDDLESTVKEQASEYNTANGTDSVKAGKPSKKGSRVSEKITFASYRDYAGFNNSQFFCGTVSDAAAAGYNLGTSLNDVTDSSKTVTGADVVSQMQDKHILITDEPAHIITFSKILYVSDGVKVTGMKKADISDDMDGTGYIVFE